MIRPHISAGPATDVFLFDAGCQELYNVGAIREESLKATVEVFNEMLQDGTPKVTGKQVKGDLELMQTAVSDLSVWDDVIGRGCHIWILSRRETFIIRDTDFALAPSEPFSKKKAASGKLSFAASGSKLSDVLYKMPGLFDPTGLIFLVNPILQKDSTQTLIYDLSNFKRSIAANGYSSAAAMWDTDLRSIKFDGVNDYLSVGNAGFIGPEMIGNADSNNRTFTTGVGSWTALNAGDTFASAAGGYSGNGGKLTVGADAQAELLALSDDVSSFVPGKSYHIELRSKYETQWSGGDIIVQVGGYTVNFSPTLSYQLFGFDFVAQTSSPEILISSLEPAAEGDILRIDSLSMTTSSDLNLNNGEMVYAVQDRNFEAEGTLSWAAAGNHSKGTGEGRGGGGTIAMSIVSGAAGSRASDNVALPSASFYPIAAGKKYTIEFWAQIGTAATNMTLALGTAGQTKTFTGLSVSAYTKCVFNFLAGSSDVGQSIRLFLSQADATGTLVDDFSITEALDLTIFVWFKKGSSTGAANYLLTAMLTKGIEIIVRDQSSGQLVAETKDGVADKACGSTPVIDGLWHCAVIVESRIDNLTLYLDGPVDSSVDISGVGKIDWEAGRNLYIGATYGGPYYCGKAGIIGLKRGVAWSADQVQTFYNFTKGQYDV